MSSVKYAYEIIMISGIPIKIFQQRECQKERKGRKKNEEAKNKYSKIDTIFFFFFLKI